MNFSKSLLAGVFAWCGFVGCYGEAAAAEDVSQAAPATQTEHAPVITSPLSKIPYKQERGAISSEFPRGAFALLVCLVLLAGAVYLIRRRLGLPTVIAHGRRLRIVESHRLSPRLSLHVVEFAGKAHLLANSENSIKCLDSVQITNTPLQDQP